jgi:hypothetical protein
MSKKVMRTIMPIAWKIIVLGLILVDIVFVLLTLSVFS